MHLSKGGRTIILQRECNQRRIALEGVAHSPNTLPTYAIEPQRKRGQRRIGFECCGK